MTASHDSDLDPSQVLELRQYTLHLGQRDAEPVGYTTRRRGDVHDFDFLAGDWPVAGRRLVRRGAGCQDWHEFPAERRAALHLGGVANVQWTIRWISARTGAMDPAVVGGFTRVSPRPA